MGIQLPLPTLCASVMNTEIKAGSAPHWHIQSYNSSCTVNYMQHAQQTATPPLAFSQMIRKVAASNCREG